MKGESEDWGDKENSRALNDDFSKIDRCQVGDLNENKNVIH